MRIIYIANSRIPTGKAHGFQIMKMCEAFVNAGAEIELWIPKRFNMIKDNPFGYYNIRETFEIKKISVIDPIPLSKFLGNVANFIESLSFAIFSYFKLPTNGDYLIYSRDQFILWILSFFSRKFIYEVHVFPGKPIFYGRIWKHAHKIVTITAALKAKIVETGIDKNKIIVAHDAVDLGAFSSITASKEELKMELGLPKDDFLIGYIGKFKPLGMEKGIATMIEALPLLDKETKMVFVGGEEPEIKDYKALANRFNVAVQCVFLGHESRAKAVKYMKAVDVLIIPSPNKPFFAFYSSPLKLFEYMASGRPIIASDLPALREVLNDKNALFFKPENSDDLARAIKMLKVSPTLGFHLSRQALADAQSHTWASRAKNILAAID